MKESCTLSPGLECNPRVGGEQITQDSGGGTGPFKKEATFRMPVPDVVVAHEVNDQDGRRQEEWTKIADRRHKTPRLLQLVDVGRFVEVMNARCSLRNYTEPGVSDL